MASTKEKKLTKYEQNTARRNARSIGDSGTSQTAQSSVHKSDQQRQLEQFAQNFEQKYGRPIQAANHANTAKQSGAASKSAVQMQKSHNQPSVIPGMDLGKEDNDTVYDTAVRRLKTLYQHQNDLASHSAAMDPAEYSRQWNETQKQVKQLEALQSAAAASRYHERNQEQIAKAMESNAGAIYQRGQTAKSDQQTILQLVAPNAENQPGYQEAVQRISTEYGISPEKSGNQYQQDLYKLYENLGKTRESSRQTVNSYGYDYDEMEQYQQRQREEAENIQARKNVIAFAKEHPVAASALSVAVQPAAGLDYLQQLISNIGHNDMDNAETYRPLSENNMTISNFVNDVRGSVSEEIEKNTDWEIFGQNVASFAYQTGMSIADSALLVGTMGSGASLFMGMSSAAQGASDALSRGANNSQAILAGLASGAAEMLFEKVSIDQLLKPKNVASVRSLLIETLKQAGVEASEESLTEISNILTDAAIMGEKSNFAQSVYQYQQQGMDEQKAKFQVYKDMISQVAWAGAGGALSGAAMGGPVNAMRYVSERADAVDAQTNETETNPSPIKAAAQQEARRTGVADTSQPPAAAAPLKGSLWGPRETEVSWGEDEQQSGADAGRKTGAAERRLRGREGEPSMRQVEKMAGTFGREGAAAFREAAKNTPAEALPDLYDSFVASYNSASRKITPEQADKINRMPAAVRTAAYQAGIADYSASAAKQAAKPGLVKDQTYRKARYTAKTERTLDTLAKAAGVSVRIVDKIPAYDENGNLLGMANARYHNGSIEIARNAKDPAGVAFTHEIVHRIRQTDPEAYRAMARLVIDILSDERYSSALASRAQSYRDLDESNMQEELVADAFGRVLGDSEYLDRIVRQNRTVWQRILDTIRDFIDRIRHASSIGLNESERQEFSELAGRAEKMAALLENALDRAKTAQRIQAENAAQEGGAVKYSFGGVNAKNADLDALRRAEALQQQGADMPSIFRETGWYIGSDGKWRFEIDDSGMEFRRDGDARLIEETDYQRMQELTEKWERSFETGGALSQQETAELEGLQEKYSDLVWEEKFMLRDFLKHDELFRAYPRLKGVSLVFDALPDGEKGYFSPRSNTIVLSDTLFGKDADVLLHELQHIIQRYEGFAGGGSPNYWNRRMEEGYSRRWPSGEEMMPSELYRNTAGEIEARDAAVRRSMTPEQRRQMMPDTGDENTVFAGGVDIGYMASAEEGFSIKEQLRAHQSELNEMDPVARVQGQSFKDSPPGTLRKEIIKKLRPTGFKVERQDIGWILYDEKRLNTSLNYLNNDADAIAYQAIPQVLKRGKRLVGHDNHKGRNYSTITIAAPVVINGKRGNMAIVVKQTGKNYYKMHRVLTPEGRTLDISEKETQSLHPAGGVTASSSLATPISSASATSVAQSQTHGKEKFSLTGDPDIRYSLMSSEISDMSNRLTEQLQAVNARADAGEITQEEATAQKMAILQAPIQELIAKYGQIEPGERPSREITTPRKTGENMRVSRTVRTVLEAEATPDELVPDIEQLVAEGAFSYEAYGDEQAIQDAENKILEVGYETALTDWTNDVRSGNVSKFNTALGWRLYDEAANRQDMKTAMTVLTNLIEHQRNAAQAVQATRILKQMPPSAQLYGVQRSIQNLQDEINRRYGAKKGPELKIDEELAQQFMEAQSQQERDAVLKEIYRDIGRQMPSTFLDKWNAWRYFAMLGNPRTHIRNIVGNLGFAPVVAAKNLTATAIESAVYHVTGGRTQRTKGAIGTGKADRSLLKACWGDYSNVQDVAMGSAKYNDSVNANQYIQEGRRIFKSENPTLNKLLSPIEKASKGNSRLLEAEDLIFFKPHYAYALAQYCKANHISAEAVQSGKIPDAARAYAIREAQKATYRDTNQFSQIISNLGRTDRSTEAGKAVGVVVDGILPFRKTPANILVRGLEYSPLGFLNALKIGVKDVKAGKATAADVIDALSSSLTGTGLLTLGIFLAAEGLVRGHGDDDDENKFLELQGHQQYSLEAGGQSFTLDWLAPEALPFFVGVNIYEQGGLGATMSDWAAAVQNISEPLLEMSCLQSLNDMFDNIGYVQSEGLSGLTAALAGAATSYLTQAIPTVFGQLERTSQRDRMTTFTNQNDVLTTNMQYTLGRASARIPGWDYQQIPYIDAWGRTEGEDSTAARAVDNFLNPAYRSEITDSSMENELLRLYEQTGNTAVFPSRAGKTVTVGGEKKYLNANEYVQYATEKGQMSYEIMTKLVNNASYKNLSDEDKVEVISDVYSYSNAVAKTSVSDYTPESWIQKASAAESEGIPVELYIVAKHATGSVTEGIPSRSDPSKSIENSTSLLKMQQLYNVKGLTDEQRQTLYESFNISESVRNYNKAAVDEKIQRMRQRGR